MSNFSILFSAPLYNFLVGEAKLESYLEQNPPVPKNFSKALIGLAECKNYLSESVTEEGDRVFTLIFNEWFRSSVPLLCLMISINLPIQPRIPYNFSDTKFTRRTTSKKRNRNIVKDQSNLRFRYWDSSRANFLSKVGQNSNSQTRNHTLLQEHARTSMLAFHCSDESQ